jgi:eukaryotic-like serine/threonine-protein kinase
VGEQLFLGRYRAVRLLGEGGMGQVYLARSIDQDRPVVVKVLHEHHRAVAQYREAFEQEIQFLSRFRHPYSVELYEAALDDPQGPCAVMEFIDGQPLDRLLQEHGPFSARQIGRLVGRLCAVLQAAHDLGIIHRDLKPANLMVTDLGGPKEMLKVLDFGLARQATPAAQGLYIPLEKFSGARAHKSVGTPEYVCPEQFRGDEVDHRGDLYSVGVILYELLSGRLPFRGDTAAGLIAAHLREPPPPLATSAGGPLVAPAVEAVVFSCLAKEVTGRPQSARELALRFGQAIRQTIWDEQEARALPASPLAGQDAGKEVDEANGLVYRFEAWMPEPIAAIKLRGFVDGRGKVTESAPGFLRVQLQRPCSVAAAEPPSGLLARLGFGRKPPPAPVLDLVDMDVFLKRPDAAQQNKLVLTVQMRPPDGDPTKAEEWRDWCDGVQRDLGSYLMAKRL